jgi:toxin ParE1/3/4
MSEYALTKRTEVDLFDIFLFGYEQFGARQAEIHAAELEHTFQLLADNPAWDAKPRR